MARYENILLNLILVFLFFKLFDVINCSLIKNEKSTKKQHKYNKYEQFTENFQFDNEDMYKLKYDDLKDINEMAKLAKKDLLSSLNKLTEQNNDNLKSQSYDKIHGFPLYAKDGHDWNTLFPHKIQLKTYNNEEYYKKFSEN
jgi:hypothetical protein